MQGLGQMDLRRGGWYKMDNKKVITGQLDWTNNYKTVIAEGRRNMFQLAYQL